MHLKPQIFCQSAGIQTKALPETSLENNPGGSLFEYASGNVHNSRDKICVYPKNGPKYIHR